MSEKSINEKSIFITPAIFNSACTTVGALENLKKQGIEIDDYLGYGSGGAVLALSVAGKSGAEIKEALAKYSNIESHMAEYLGDKTFGDLKKETGKNLMIQTTQVNPDGTKSSLIFSAEKFPDLSIAEACRVSTTLTSPLGVITRKATSFHELKYGNDTYKCCDGNISSVQIPDLIKLKEYKNSILSTMKFPIHPRSKRIAALMSSCKVVLAPKVSYLSSIPPRFRTKSNLKKFIKSMSKKGDGEVNKQTELIEQGQPKVTKEILGPSKESVVKQMIQIKETKDNDYWKDYDLADKERKVAAEKPLNNEIKGLSSRINMKKLF